MSLTKRPLDYGPDELRQHARGEATGGDRTSANEAKLELERRRDNLRNAVIPDWEREARGTDPREWALW